MGDPIRRRKKFARPKKPWDKTRLEAEQKIKKEYGLKNKRELWKTEAIVRKKRQSARKLLAMPLEQREKTEKDLVKSLNRIGILQSDALVEDILGLGVSEILERRLQTIVMRKGLANTIKQARQFIVHGHISVNGKKVTAPAYLVKEKDTVTYYDKPMILKPIQKESIEKPAVTQTEATLETKKTGKTLNKNSETGKETKKEAQQA